MSSRLIAFDVAILPPPAIARRAIELSAALPEKESVGLRLGGDVLPHVTLTQQFVPANDLDAVLEHVGAALAGFKALRLDVTGAGRGRSSVWIAIEASPLLNELHRRLMDTLVAFERTGGTGGCVRRK